MKRFISLFFIAFFIFLFLDLIWLGYVGKPIYQFYLHSFLRDSPVWGSAVLFYGCFILGMITFVIKPAIEQNSYRYALLYGSFYGFITYMTYELTNYAVLDGWPLGIVFIDIAWGTVLSAMVSILSTRGYLYFFGPRM